MNIKTRKHCKIFSGLLLLLPATYIHADVVVMQKLGTNFSIDGDHGAKLGQQVYLYSSDRNNVNQQWQETNIDGVYFSYRKQGTEACLDGGDGAANRQAVTLENCEKENVNQHWKKVSNANGTFRLEKRETQYSIDGNHGGANRQQIYLWQSGAENNNQHWQFTSQGGTGVAPAPTISLELPSSSSEFSEGELVLVSVDADDSNSVITSVNLYINDEFVRTEYKFPYLWGSRDTNLQNLSPGSYTLNAVAQYNEGLSTQVSRTITITNDPDTPDDDNKPNANVSSLIELREAIQQSNLNIVMQAGNYSMTDLPEGSRELLFSGSNNTVNLVDVFIDVPVGSTDDERYILMEGNGNTVLGGTFEDTYASGLDPVVDFVEYNNDRSTLAYGLSGDPVMDIRGDNNTIDGLKLTVRGSFPYGYGSNLGIGSDNVFGLSKRCGIVIFGDDTIIDNVEVQMKAFCHGIFMLEPAANTIVRNTLVEGVVRETNAMLNDGPDSLLARNNNRDANGNAVLPNEVDSLAEDGIRAYRNIGHVTVENSTVRRMRGGIRLYLGSTATVTNSTAVDNADTNFNLPPDGTITNSVGNFTNGPLNDHRLGRSGQDIEMTILPSPNAIGAHNIMDINGHSHQIVLHRAGGPEDTRETRVILVTGNNSTIRNETEYRVVLEDGTRNNTIISAGDVTDSGDNNVSRIELEL